MKLRPGTSFYYVLGPHGEGDISDAAPTTIEGAREMAARLGEEWGGPLTIMHSTAIEEWDAPPCPKCREPMYWRCDAEAKICGGCEMYCGGEND